MKEPKTKPSSGSAAKVKGKPSKAPKQIPEKAARKTKEAVTKASREAKEILRRQANPKSDAEESPEQYAENRIEQSTEYAADRLKPSSRGTRSRTDADRLTRQEPEERFTGRDTVSPSEPRRTADRPQPRTEQAPFRPEPSFEREKQRFRAEANVRSLREKPQSHPTEPIREAEPKAFARIREADTAPIREPDAASPIRQADTVSIREPEKRLTVREANHTSAPREREQISRLEVRDPVAREPSRMEVDEPIRPKVREYQVEKLRKPEKPSTVEPREPEPRVENIRQPDAPVMQKARAASPRSDTVRERMDASPFREPNWDIKELHRDAPKERARDVSSYSEPKSVEKESPTVQSQQRQLAIDKYRQAVRERMERTEGKDVTSNQDGVTQSDVHTESAPSVSPSQSTPSAYTDSKPIRSVEQTPSARSEGLRLPDNAHTPRGIREGRSIKDANRAVSGVEKSSKATIKTADKSIKTADRSIKTTEHGIKTGAKTVEKTAEATAKTAQKTAQAAAKTAEATAKAAQTAAKTAQAAAKAAAHAAKVAAQAIANAIKAIIAAIKSLIAAIAAGGWVAVLIIAIIAILAVVLCLCFGVFSSNEASSDTGRPMTAAIQEINSDFVSSIDAKINRFKKRYKPDEVELVYEGDTDSNGSVMNWQDVLGIYAVSTTTDPDNPTDVLTVSRDKIETLRSIFKRMNSVSYDTDLETEEIPSVDEHGDPIFDDEGNPVMEEKKTLTITITVSSMDYRDAAEEYGFTDDQKEMLREMMRPEYYPLFAELTGDVIGDGGEFGFGLDINPDLPPNELGYQIVQAAKRYIGRSYASMDCSTLCRTAYRDCGLNSMNGLSSVRMAQKCKEMGCLFTDASQLQAGDLIFFASLDPSRGPDYCRDRRRCGDGKCRRWLHIHHVAIYINDQYLIDSTGGDNSVQIRKLYGQNTKTLKWVCFGRPTT